MDFFESQEAARRRSGWLYLVFAFAVAGVVLGVHAAASGVGHLAGLWNGMANLVDPASFGVTAAVTLGVIFLGTGFKTLQLSGGGEVVARDLGGRRIDPNTTDTDERRLMNVVEEMAIASGMPVPDVYVLESEDAINAFAAGRSVSDAVVGVTRGCIRKLNRDELQGVIAHEFSHILNGDMRLNFRLIGLVHGILVLSILGRIALEIAARASRGTDDRRAAGALIVILLLGVSLLVIGSIGAFFGKLIKAAVSRQREFLADASAVQFTRNPQGLSGALQKIAASSMRGRIRSGRAEEASHLFFANGLSGVSLTRLLSTHPPIEERIRAIDPLWNGEMRGGRGDEIVPPPVVRRQGTADSTAPAGYVRFDGPRPPHLDQADRMRNDVARWVERRMTDRGEAKCVVYAVLLAQDDQLREAEIGHLLRVLDEASFRSTMNLFERIRGLHSSEKFALVEMAIPLLRRMAPEEFRDFTVTTGAIISVDGQRSLFEWAMEHMIHRHLDRFFRGGREVPVRFRHAGEVADEIALLLAVLASYAGEVPSSRSAVADAFRALGEEAGRRIDPPGGRGVDLAEIDAALARLEAALPRIKRFFLSLAESVVLADGRLRSEEAELLRAMADAIGAPVPPLLRLDP